MKQNKRNKIKIVIIVLSVLLTLSLAALAGALIYNRSAVQTDTTVTVPDNLITPDKDKTDNTETDGSNLADETQNSSDTNPTENISATENSTDNKKSATAIALYNKQPQDNTAFTVDNMFPGDSETKYYGLQVSYHDKVTVHFGAEIRNGYEKLAEVMKVKITLLGIDEVMYDGLMKDMPQSLTYTMTSAESTTDEIYYEITAYLDTSVGNEYQSKDLIADFKWWVEETGNLEDAPQTGDNSNIVLWSVMTVVSFLALLILSQFCRKREGRANDR